MSAVMSPRAAREQVRAWFVLALAAAIAVAVIAGFLYALLGSLGGAASTNPRASQAPGGSAAPGSPATAVGRSDTSTTIARQDELATRPMWQLPPSAARPQPLVTATAGTPIALPPGSDANGPAMSGFAQTPAGALAQLTAIDVAALQDLDPQRVASVHAWAALPGAVPLDEWTPTVAVDAARVAAGQPGGAAELSSVFTPLAGQIKGTVGDSFVVACVLGEWQITYRSTSRAGAGDCQRMVWHDGRWRIGPGAQPAYAPSAWPGSADALRAGWRALTNA
jgi:hypothetical protein